MLKYGKIALFDGLSGSSGQVASPHRPATTEGLPALPLPAAMAALVDAESIPEPLPAPSARRRRTRPASAVGADEAVV
jgi:hypothetical protein